MAQSDDINTNVNLNFNTSQGKIILDQRDGGDHFDGAFDR